MRVVRHFGGEMKQTICCALMLTAIALSGCDKLFQSKNFDDCILNHMDGVTSDKAALAIHRSCREKFPEGSEERQRSRDLTYMELSHLDGRAGLEYDEYKGSIYNGNEDIAVTSVTIAVIGELDNKKTSRGYTSEVTIPPLSTKDFKVKIVVGDEGSKYSWNITGARGYRK